MSILIKGMEMPDRCGRCFFARWSNLHQTARCTLAQEACFEDFSKDYKNRRADFCPLVELPPHGRLIDADAIQDYNVETFGKRLLIIDTAPTVIEAEGEKDGR